MKLTRREEDSCRVDAFAEFTPPYEVRIVPGWNQPEYELCDPYEIMVDGEDMIQVQIRVTVGQEYMQALREHGVRYAREGSSKEEGK